MNPATNAPNLTTGTAETPLTHWIRSSLSALSFWSAITLPVLYLPLVVGGIDDTAGLVVFLGLFGLHVLALIGGRGYHDGYE